MTKKQYRYIIQSGQVDDVDRYDNDPKSSMWQTEYKSNNFQCLVESLLIRLNEDENFNLNTWFRLIDTKTNIVINF